MANIDLTTYRKDELAERDWMDPCAEFYLASEVDNLIADKDREIARLKERKSPDLLRGAKVISKSQALSLIYGRRPSEVLK